MKAAELRASILQEAVSGKLVPQIASEGTADELLKQIEAERAALIKAGKIKKEKPLPEITEEEIPFEIPKSWKWAYLKDICIDFLVPQRDKPKEFGGTIPWCRIEDIDGKYLCGTKSNQYVSESTVAEMNLRINPVGTVICSCSASLGVAAIVKNPCCTNQTFIGLVLYSEIFNEYLYYYLLSIGKAFRKIGSGTTIPYISKIKFHKLLIPLPPLSEQKRIVAKLEELLPLIDQYAEEEEKLSTITAQFPDAMRKSILLEAVSGKLVPQIASEGTAEELLKQIEAERVTLVKTGKIKREKPLPEITEDEIPFEIPKSWKWVRFSQCIDLRDGTHDTPSYHESGYPLITSKNLSDGKLDWTQIKYISKTDFEKINERSLVELGDILYAMIGSIGNPVIVTEKRDFAIKNVALFKIFKNTGIDVQYLYWYLYFAQDFMKLDAKGGVQIFVPLQYLRNYLFPLPPLSEQKRIVAKIEELMGIIDRMRN